MQIISKAAAALTLFGTVAFSGTASAEGRVANALVTEISVTTTRAWVRFNVNITNSRPSCIGSGWQNEFMFDATTATGQSFLKILSAAMLAGKRVDASGLSSCTSNQAETLGYVKLYD